MSLLIRAYAHADYEKALAVCIAAFTPIHQGFAAALGPKVFQLQYHDWQARYAETFRAIGSDASTKVFVAEQDGVLAGFVFATLDGPHKTGEIGLNAVAPAFQRRGIARSLYAFALSDLKGRGAEIAYVGTAGDAAHAPARAAYRALGFDKVIPSLHLFKNL
jgi:ribosomal protein S18 acetylase RimI-like enzyme